MMKHLWIPIALGAGLAVFLLWKKEKSANGAQQAARQELLDHAKQFSGYYQPLYQAVADKNAPLTEKLLELWKQQLSDCPAAEGCFGELCRKEQDPLLRGEKWIQMLERWGLRHDEAGSVIHITKDHQKLYLFDDIYAVGAAAKVVRPAWWLEAEEGLICVETGGAEIE